MRIASCAAAVLIVAGISGGQEALDLIKHDHAQLPTVDELLLFYPSKYPDGNWTPAGLQFNDVFFSAEDTTRLHGWFCPCENPRAIILIAHGNAGHVASRAPWLTYLQSKARVAAFMFDYRTDYSGPLLQSHGTADRVIPFELGKRLFEAANEPKMFLELSGAGHDDWLTDQYVATFHDFIGRLAPKPSRVDDQVIHEPEATANEDRLATPADNDEQPGSPFLVLSVLSVFVLFGTVLIVVRRRRQRRGISAVESHP